MIVQPGPSANALVLVRPSRILGGEPSGHIICLDHTTTGDALIASVKLLESLKDIDFDISKVLQDFTKLPLLLKPAEELTANHYRRPSILQ